MSIPKIASIGPYPAKFPTLSSVFYFFSLFINYGVHLGRSGTFPADSNEALLSLYALVLVGMVPFVFSGVVAMVTRLLLGKSFKRAFDGILVKVNILLGVLLLASVTLMMIR